MTSTKGDNEGALEAIQRAVAISEKLAEENRIIYGPGLALSLNNLSIAFDESGDKKGAHAAIRRAIAIHEEFAKGNPAIYGPDLGNSLLFYCYKFELHLSYLTRVKEIYLQVHDTCFYSWVRYFRFILNLLLVRANESNNQDAIRLIESIIQDIDKLHQSDAQ